MKQKRSFRLVPAFIDMNIMSKAKLCGLWTLPPWVPTSSSINEVGLIALHGLECAHPRALNIHLHVHFVSPPPPIHLHIDKQSTGTFHVDLNLHEFEVGRW